MVRYNINFYLISLYKIDGIYFDTIPKHISVDLIMKDNKYMHDPIKFIDASIENHFTQIIFLLKEYFTDKSKGFCGWTHFTESELKELVEENKYVYINNFKNSDMFFKDFPEKISYFLNNYCYIDKE